MRLMITSLVAALVAGCASPKSDDYCLVTQPLRLGSEETIDYLLRHDRPLLRGIVTHNETREELC